MSVSADKKYILNQAGTREGFEEFINSRLFILRVDTIPEEVAKEDTITVPKLKAVKSKVDSAEAKKHVSNDDYLGLKVNKITIKPSPEKPSKPVVE